MAQHMATSTKRRMQQFAYAVNAKLSFPASNDSVLVHLRGEHIATCTMELESFQETMQAYFGSHDSFQEALNEFRFNMGMTPVCRFPSTQNRTIAGFPSYHALLKWADVNCSGPTSLFVNGQPKAFVYDPRFAA